MTTVTVETKATMSPAIDAPLPKRKATPLRDRFAEVVRDGGDVATLQNDILKRSSDILLKGII